MSEKYKKSEENCSRRGGTRRKAESVGSPPWISPPTCVAAACATLLLSPVGLALRLSMLAYACYG